MGTIIKADSLGINIGELNDEQDVINALRQIDAVRELLKAANRFRDESVRFAKYEAYALVRAFEISGDTSLIKGKYRKLAAEWLASMSEADRDVYIAQCEDGKTIDNVYKERVYKPEQRAALGKAVEECKEKAREGLRRDGMVNVPNTVREHSAKFPKSMVKEITDGVRNAVRKSGGVGIGGGTGIYIDPDRKSQYISDAIATRIDAVARDIDGIAELANRCESKPVFHIRGDGSNISYVDVTYMILAGIGCAKVMFDSPKAKKDSVSILKQIAGDVR